MNSAPATATLHFKVRKLKVNILLTFSALSLCESLSAHLDLVFHKIILTYIKKRDFQVGAHKGCI